MLIKMSNSTIKSLRSRFHNHDDNDSPTTCSTSQKLFNVGILVHSLQTIMKPLPKAVPMVIEVEPNVPETVTLGRDRSNRDLLRIARCALNLLSYALRAQGHSTTPIRLKIKLHQEAREEPLKGRLLFECNVASIDMLDLAVQSVALQMDALSGGEHGFRAGTGSDFVFWFSVPAELLGDTLMYHADDIRIVTLEPRGQPIRASSSR